MSNAVEITDEIARKVLETVDVGLVKGLGNPEPGQMCVEAAVNYALGADHGDQPACVAPSLRRLKIRLNDSAWSSNEARTKGLRRLALAQLGSAGVLDEHEFAKRVSRLAIQKALPDALRAAAKIQKDDKHKYALLKAAQDCEADPTRANAVSARVAADAAYAAADAAYAAANAAANAANAANAAAAAEAYAAAAYASAAYAYAAADAAYVDAADDAYARDKSLAEFCENVVQILIDMKAPGCQWLYLTVAS